MAGVASLVYNTLFKRTSTYVTVAVIFAFVYEAGTDKLTDTIYDNYNRGVSPCFLHFILFTLFFLRLTEAMEGY